jgi:hypothetical protein
MNPNSENRSRRDRLEHAVQTLIEDRRAAGSPVSEEERLDWARLVEKLMCPTLETTPDGWTAQALALLGTAKRSLGAEASGSPQADLISEIVQEAAGKVRDALAAVRGVLVYDTAARPLAGVRNAHSQPRQILIAYPVGRLYLQVDRKDDRLDLIGQFIPTDRSGLPDDRSARVTSGADRQEIPLPESGEFRFQLPLEPSLDLHLRWGEASLIEHVKS